MIEQFEEVLKEAEFQRRKYKELKTKTKKEIKNNKQQLRDLEKSLEIVKTVASQVQNEVHLKLSGLVQKCLDAVFKNPYKFSIQFKGKRNNSEAKIVLKKNGIEMDYKSIGGGVIDVISFALRISCIMMTHPKPRRILILDEPFKFLSNKNSYRAKIKNLLLTLTQELDFQIIMITHDPELECGQIFEITD